MTKKEMYNAILAVPAVAENEEMVEFLEHQIELLNSRSTTKKPTKVQLENATIKDTIYQILQDADSPMRVKDLLEDERLADYSSSKITALLRQMLPETGDGRLTRTVEKKVAYFSIA